MSNYDDWVKATSDFYIRYLFGSPGNESILMHFINSILSDSGFQEAVQLEIQNPFNLKNDDTDKESILDVKAVDQEGRIFNVEIQVAVDQSFIRRTLYYWARNYHRQLVEGEQYHELKPVICINILENTLFKDLENAHSCFMAIEKNKPQCYLISDFQIHFFELSKVDFDSLDGMKDELTRWAYYLKFEGNPEKEEGMHFLADNDEVFEKAHKAYKKFTADDHLREKYEARRKWKMDQASNLYHAREDGLKEGMEKGLEQGLEQGHKQAQKEIIQSMLSNGLDLETISKITSLSVEEIKHFL